MIIGIIGGGASGMAAALAAAENPNAQVHIFERQARLCRKLQATGNGRCNLTNLHAAKGGYHGDDPTFSQSALAAFDPEQTLAWFADLGLVTVAEPSGRVYPYSDQANSVVDVLRFALDKPNITVHTGFAVEKLRKDEKGYTVTDGQETYSCDKVIVACGGLAGTKLGGSLSGYKLLAKLGHRATALRPALVQVKSAWSGVTALKGVRANCRVQVLHNGEEFSQSAGELQFTEYGLSGPVIFEVSRDVCRQPGQWSCRLDFMPQHTQAQVLALLKKKKSTSLKAEELLTGILHNRLGRVLTKTAGIRADEKICNIADAQLDGVARLVKGLEVAISEPLGMDSAQVTAGGVITEDFDPYSMESKLHPGLYACGEVLDVDGDCGGYNLQWAWSSGRCAGLHAGKETL